jgi:hypothetical protein
MSFAVALRTSLLWFYYVCFSIPSLFCVGSCCCCGGHAAVVVEATFVGVVVIIPVPTHGGWNCSGVLATSEAKGKTCKGAGAWQCQTCNCKLDFIICMVRASVVHHARGACTLAAKFTKRTFYTYSYTESHGAQGGVYVVRRKLSACACPSCLSLTCATFLFTVSLAVTFTLAVIFTFTHTLVLTSITSTLASATDFLILVHAR